MFSRILKDNNLTQKMVADSLNISQQSISKWCCGISEPSLGLVIKMSDTFHIPIEEIVLSFKKGDIVK